MAQRKTDRKNEQGDQTRTRILEEAMRLAACHGYEGTRLSMIRKATGLSASSIYWHFSDKDELFAAALERSFELQSQSIPNWLDSPPGDSRTADLYGNILQFPRIDDSMAYWRFGLQISVVRPRIVSPARARFLQIRRESTQWLVKWWERTLPADMEQKEAAAGLLGRLTIAIRDSEFIQRHGSGGLDEDRVTWMIAACLNAAADRVAELASSGSLDAVRDAPAAAPAPAPVPEGSGESPRDVFLRAAEDTIVEFGYDGVTVARVCEKAGLPASSLYWSFKGKDDLVATVVDNACRGWDKAKPAMEARPLDGDWSVVLKRLQLKTLEGFTARTRIRRLGLLLLLQPAAGPGAGNQRLEPVLQNMQSMTDEWFRSVLDPELDDTSRSELAGYLSECLFRILDGLMLSRQIEEGPWDPELLSDVTSTALYRVAGLMQAGNTVAWNA
ncbi:TetR/AcrR family transcriptional regulator [Arthrobacter sp. APC 3897]|uniref:TetR/AcrR family transcriptional regulator n=1 Tax=Arthrobacter sp. APC 3897 TaxID=3035204 RepID=UPI0025B2E23B|nr:TetR/AcrR family transcriptional regulator [Arthrobacter sp. APC 3897]MDN3480909.1 TetR/AcrR family transcriptional regulator [Arthrobacter sp. APC 3897]